MKNTFNFILAAISILAVASCGDKSLTPKTFTISGPLKDYYKVVDRSYKIQDGKIAIEFERTEEGFPEPWDEEMKVGYQDNTIEPGFAVSFLDKDGDQIYEDKTDIVWDADALNLLAGIGVGETYAITFDAPDKNAATFKVMSSYKYHEPEVPDLLSTDFVNATEEILDAYGDAAKNVTEAYKDAANAINSLNNLF